MLKDFDKFMSQLKETNATLDFYTDFNKIRRNVQNIEISLNMLNFLLGKDDLYSAVKALWDRDPKVFNVLDILIATRREGKKKFIDVDGEIKLIKTLFSSVDGIMKFFNETGLVDFFKNKDVHDLVDYVFGVEAGLDTHARKNRSGDATESLLHRILQTNGIPHGIEVYSTEYDELRDVLKHEHYNVNQAGLDGIKFKHGILDADWHVINKPPLIRSIHAAFDPMRQHESDLLA